MSGSGVAQGVPVAGGLNEAADGALTIYPKHPAADDVYFIGGAWAPAAITATEKRFSDGELAAEFQFARLTSYVRWHRTRNYPGDNALFDHYEKGLEQEWTLERFATLPHYDEDPT